MGTTDRHERPRTRIRRVPRNARYDLASVERVLDRGQIAHVAFASDGHPYCIPTLYARIGDRILIHGSRASRMSRLLATGVPASTTVLELEISEASVKTRNGPPDDDGSDDAQLETWAGVIPVNPIYGTPMPSPGLRAGIEATPSITNLLSAANGSRPGRPRQRSAAAGACAGSCRGAKVRQWALNRPAI